jgi:hypothetical protein
MRAALVAAAAVVLALAGSSAALACVCAALPLDERLDDADAAVVGRIVAERAGEVRGAPQRLLTVEVDQRVKGDVERMLVVRSPSGTDCDITVPRNRQTGFLLTKAPDGDWVGTTCSLVGAGELVAAGGEPRGGAIKVAVGLVILALVLLWSFARLRRGTRPQLPGASGDQTPRV